MRTTRGLMRGPLFPREPIGGPQKSQSFLPVIGRRVFYFGQTGILLNALIKLLTWFERPVAHRVSDNSGARQPHFLSLPCDRRVLFCSYTRHDRHDHGGVSSFQVSEQPLNSFRSIVTLFRFFLFFFFLGISIPVWLFSENRIRSDVNAFTVTLSRDIKKNNYQLDFYRLANDIDIIAHPRFVPKAEHDASLARIAHSSGQPRSHLWNHLDD